MKQKKKEHCVMSRRCFLNWMGMGTLAPIIAPGLVSRSIESHKSGDANMEKAKPQEIAAQSVKFKPEDLVAYCGRYCGRCGICGFNIQTSLAALQNVMQVAGFRQEAEHLGWPLMRDIAVHCCTEFEGQVSSFARLAGKFFSRGCRDNCVPPCEIAKCCKEKGFFTCAECSDLEGCGRIEKPELLKNLEDIRNVGVKPWAKKQFEDVTRNKAKSVAGRSQQGVWMNFTPNGGRYGYA